MSGYNTLRASDGTGNAVLGHVTLARSIASTVLKTDSVSKYPTGATPSFICTVGTLDGTGFMTAGTITEFIGHLSGADIIIDSFEPGFSDLGNTVGQVIVIKQTTGWANSVTANAQVGHNDNGTHKDTALDVFLRPTEMMYDFIVPGGAILTGTGYGSTLAWNLTAGVCYINGKRYTIAAATGVVVASKDTYFDVTAAVTPGGVATLAFTGGNSVANNAASPALAANSIRLGIIQSGANIASVAAVNQGEPNKVLPIATSIPYTVTDSIGNLICPRDPNRKIIGYRQGSGATASAAYADMTGFNLNCIIPDGRKARVGFYSPQAYTAGLATSGIAIVDVTAAATIQDSNQNFGNTVAQSLKVESPIVQPAGGVRNYKIQYKCAGGVTFNLPVTTSFYVELT